MINIFAYKHTQPQAEMATNLVQAVFGSDSTIIIYDVSKPQNNVSISPTDEVIAFGPRANHYLDALNISEYCSLPSLLELEPLVKNKENRAVAFEKLKEWKVNHFPVKEFSFTDKDLEKFTRDIILSLKEYLKTTQKYYIVTTITGQKIAIIDENIKETITNVDQIINIDEILLLKYASEILDIKQISIKEIGK